MVVGSSPTGRAKYHDLYIIMDFIKNNITIDEVTKCWNWNKSLTSAGYGQFQRDKKYWTTHTFVYVQLYGEIPKGSVIRHTCHNRKCCNPDHLVIGTHKDNYHDSRDAHIKADNRRAKGCIILGKHYRTFMDATNALKISSKTLYKYTDNVTRVFDVDSYRAGCIKANRKQRI